MTQLQLHETTLALLRHLRGLPQLAAREEEFLGNFAHELEEP